MKRKKKPQAKRTERTRKPRPEDGVATAQRTFAKILQKADPQLTDAA